MSTEDANTQEGNDEYHCPWDGCDRTLGSEHGIKCHHKRIHGVSIAGASVECDWCGSTKTVTPYKVDKYEHHFCSPEENENLSKCQRDWYSENLVGEDSPTWSGGKVDVECAWCGSIKPVAPATVTRSVNHFCNTTCKGKWQSENCCGENSFRYRGGFRPVEVECEWCGEPREVKRSYAETTDSIFCKPKKDETFSECHMSWLSKHFSGKNHPRWSGGPFPYGPGWDEAKKEQVRERDDRTCQNPKCRRSEEGHIERFGRKHAVHHIQKARNVDDPEARNHPDNLITLCISKECHSKWEKMSPLRPIVD